MDYTNEFDNCLISSFGDLIRFISTRTLHPDVDNEVIEQSTSVISCDWHDGLVLMECEHMFNYVKANNDLTDMNLLPGANLYIWN